MNTGEILIYHNSEGSIKIDVHLEEETAWLTQVQFYEAESTEIPAQWNVISKEQNV